MQVIPLRNVPRQRMTVRLGGQVVSLLVWRQPSDDSWYISMEYPVGVPMLSGRRLVLASFLIGNQPVLFTGDIVCLALSVSNVSEPGIAPWGNTHDLIYVP